MKSAVTILLLVLAAAVVRVACFPFTWEQGDAPARIALAIRWLHAPSYMSAKECIGYGPLPIFLSACILSVWHDPYTAPRFVSLLLGMATVVPLFLLARLLFNQRAAVFASLFFVFYTTQVKASGTALAEAPFGFFLLLSVFFLFRFRRDGQARDLCWAAVLLSLASMVRYEGWLYIPLMGVLAVRPGTSAGPWTRRAISALKPATAFVAIAGILPIYWMIASYIKVGDPLWAQHFIVSDHARMAASAAAMRGSFSAFVYNALFLPGVVVLSLTPVVALLALLSLWRSMARRQTLAYAALLLPFLIIFIQGLRMRTALMARYPVLLGLLLLPYAGAQMEAWTAGLSRSGAVRRTAAVLLSAAVVLAGLFAAAYLPKLPFHQKFWSVAPVSPFMFEARQVYDLIQARMKPGDKIIQDANSFYTHIVVFNVSRHIYEDWWGRPALGDLKTPEERIRLLESSAPGFVLLENDRPDLATLLNLPAERIPDGLGVRLSRIYSGPKLILYELSPKTPG